MQKQSVLFRDLGMTGYKDAWDLQEKLLQENVRIKTVIRSRQNQTVGVSTAMVQDLGKPLSTIHHLLFVEHPPVFTLGKSGHPENLLIGMEQLEQRGVQFFHTNRGGDITFHGEGQVVGYPIFDLEHFGTDIGKYLRNIEQVVIATLAEYGILGERSPGETGVWINPGTPGHEQKICAIGVRCSRWITMHGFALNVNTDLSYFNDIIPCGIQNKQVTSLQQQLGHPVPLEDVKSKLRHYFEKVFDVELQQVDAI